MPTPKTITILTSGTRGDVQPYIALALQLQRTGYHVRIATHATFQPLIAAYGIDVAIVDGNPNTLLARYPQALTFNENLAHSIKATWHYLRAVRPHFERMLYTAWNACRSTDALAVTLPTTWGHSIAQRLGVPCIWTPVQPISRTTAFPSVFQPWRTSLGARYNYLTHLVLEQVLWQPWRVSINRWRRMTLDLSPLPAIGPYQQIYEDRIPFVYGFSAHVVPRPTDWPLSHTASGFWFLDQLTHWQPSSDLQAFLAAKPVPLAIGFGSMGERPAHTILPVVLTALERTGQRAVLQVDRRDRAGIDLPPTVFATDALPHDWLFPRVAAAVHHGGAGTTAASLRAGIPTIVVPFGVDQFFWGDRVAALQAGPTPIPARALAVERLTLAIERGLDGRIRDRANLLGQQIRAEDGVGRAAALLHSYIG